MYKTPKFVLDKFGSAAYKKPRLESRAVLWANLIDLSGIRPAQRKTARLLLLALAIASNAYGERKAPTYACWPDYRDLQQTCEIAHRSTIKSAREQLERIGAITAHRLEGTYKQDFFVYQLRVPAGAINRSTLSLSEPANSPGRCNGHTIKGTNVLENTEEKKIKSRKVAASARNPTATLEEPEKNPEEKKTFTKVQREYTRQYREAFESRKPLTRKDCGQLNGYAEKLKELGFDAVETMPRVFDSWYSIARDIEQHTEYFDLPDRPTPGYMSGNVHIIAECLSTPVKRYAWGNTDLDIDVMSSEPEPKPERANTPPDSVANNFGYSDAKLAAMSNREKWDNVLRRVNARDRREYCESMGWSLDKIVNV